MLLKTNKDEIQNVSPLLYIIENKRIAGNLYAISLSE